MNFEEKIKAQIEKHKLTMESEKKAIDSLQYALSIYHNEKEGLDKTKEKKMDKPQTRGRPKKQVKTYVKPSTDSPPQQSETVPKGLPFR